MPFPSSHPHGAAVRGWFGWRVLDVPSLVVCGAQDCSSPTVSLYFHSRHIWDYTSWALCGWVGLRDYTWTMSPTKWAFNCQCETL